jgi:hypothetical protein
MVIKKQPVIKKSNKLTQATESKAVIEKTVARLYKQYRKVFKNLSDA